VIEAQRKAKARTRSLMLAKGHVATLYLE